MQAAPQSAPRAMVPVNSDFPQPSDRAAPRGFYPAIRRSVNLCRHVASSHARDQSPFRDDRSPPSLRPPRGRTADNQTVGLHCCGWRTCASAVGLVHIGSTLARRRTVGRSIARTWLGTRAPMQPHWRSSDAMAAPWGVVKRRPHCRPGAADRRHFKRRAGCTDVAGCADVSEH
jgi:hypothetical protein